MTIAELVLLPPPRNLSSDDLDYPLEPQLEQERVPHDFIMLTSDGRAYMVHWGPPPGTRSRRPSAAPPTEAQDPEKAEPNGFSPELGQEEEVEEPKWEWHGTCFHPKRTLEGEAGLAEQEKELDKGKGGSTLGVSEKMALVAVGCEEYVVSLALAFRRSRTCLHLLFLPLNSGSIAVYNIYPTKPGQAPPFPPPLSPLAPSISHVLSLRKSLNSTASGLETGRVTCLAWTSDGYALAVGWALGWSIWSVYGRLGSWSVLGSLRSGYGVEGEKSESFEDHFMHGVRNLVSSSLLFMFSCAGFTS